MILTLNSLLCIEGNYVCSAGNTLSYLSLLPNLPPGFNQRSTEPLKVVCFQILLKF